MGESLITLKGSGNWVALISVAAKWMLEDCAKFPSQFKNEDFHHGVLNPPDGQLCVKVKCTSQVCRFSNESIFCALLSGGCWRGLH